MLVMFSPFFVAFVADTSKTFGYNFISHLKKFLIYLQSINFFFFFFFFFFSYNNLIIYDKRKLKQKRFLKPAINS